MIIKFLLQKSSNGYLNKFYRLLVSLNEIGYILNLMEKEPQIDIDIDLFVTVSDDVQELSRLIQIKNNRQQPFDINKVLEFSMDPDSPNFSFIQFILNNYDDLKKIEYSTLFNQSNIEIINYIYENHRYIISEPTDKESFYNFTVSKFKNLIDIEKYKILSKYYQSFILNSFFFKFDQTVTIASLDKQIIIAKIFKYLYNFYLKNNNNNDNNNNNNEYIDRAYKYLTQKSSDKLKIYEVLYK
ncbi:expressed protein [Dictyostelium purpureum]|uniref:Expressed protein n=1 Tax=Dictyostelium purpureum TaxID=5786 RepID=F0ZIS7_DICPU|nr:uncharacterized protein DICPUDRAFT_91893 [Dictyostelium purpureum]EGC36128.1 expressed protein [Dictyostelium purpureum]|eukprot:XP_003287321.1 expressed protein [Dictyostelium purpureum]